MPPDSLGSTSTTAAGGVLGTSSTAAPTTPPLTPGGGGGGVGVPALALSNTWAGGSGQGSARGFHRGYSVGAGELGGGGVRGVTMGVGGEEDGGGPASARSTSANRGSFRFDNQQV